jgi:hypothetical protein
MVGLLLPALLAPGCVPQLRKTAPPVPAEPVADCHPWHDEIDRLEQELVDREIQMGALEGQVYAHQLQLLERNSIVSSLREQVATQQAEFDQAIAEVVRSKSKVRSLESKAQAASDLAEAEIALKGLRAQFPEGGEPAALVQAQELLKLGGTEFKSGNYGGSLYVTSQARAKLRLAEVQVRIRNSLAPVDGEVRFATPVDLQLTRTSNLREAPSLDAEVLATLPQGTALRGYSYKGSWVRVETGESVAGWVFQGLVREAG